MNEPKFTHQFRQEAYDKAMLKYDKMLENENGQKFLAHLIKSFLQSGTEHKVQDDPEGVGVLRCDLTKTKVVTEKNYNSFKATYKAKMECFERNEDETDEQFENRRDAYVDAFKSSNPYAVNADLAWTADKTDKILCREAIDALAAKFNSIKNDPQYSEFMKLIEVKVFKKKFDKNKKKNFNKQNGPGQGPKGIRYAGGSRGPRSSGHTLGDNPALAEFKSKLE